jgi:hypothetical protein
VDLLSIRWSLLSRRSRGCFAIVASQPAEGLRPLLDPANPGNEDMLD